MSKEDKRVLIMEFERDRKLLMTISSQKQQLSIQIEIMKASLEELSKTKETKVYKAVGNLLVPKTVEEMKKETQERKESFELKLKTVEKQEESLLKKLNSLKAKIEGTEKEESSDEKKEKKSKK
ncbi:MAG: prefoldin subunit beta [Candidatus Diapherotrites archaeon]|jgi:prefoldin beta subunit|uniref:Prefoldin subunit beta n=1 Tax=Candidatus Iainarchaeum sp. TaxID=3101447 RepID=A0A7K4BZU1_9ARCH|nr:prefoldin subunit beta [Candidatus Diapherotrites archaeon]